MIIWINGAFGAGKTQTAFELNRRIEKSFVYDPENIGFFINKNTPVEIRKGDFQDYNAWREMNFSLIKQISHDYDGIIIIPMTIVDEDYFYDIIGNLRKAGVEIKHFTLMATRETLVKRLKGRGDRENSWPVKQIERCLSGLSKDIFKEHIITDEKSIDEVAEIIARESGIELMPSLESGFKRRFIRICTQLKHIRIFKWRL